MKNLIPKDSVYWYVQINSSQRLDGDIEADVVIVGGGMAGLSAAQSFNAKGLSVILVEKDFCGAGASGKSSGFITPDSEYSLQDFATKYDKDVAKSLWEFVSSGVDFVQNNIKNFSLDCDYSPQDTLILANSENKFKSVLLPEANLRKELGYVTNIYTQSDLTLILGSDKYYGGISYSGTFGINGYKYCQNLKLILNGLGVKIFEQTPATQIHSWGVDTTYGKVKAKYVIVCVDKFLPEFNKFEKDIYSAQTFLMVSSQLSNDQVKQIFPQNKYMIWDTDLVYNYWRITGDNRILLGGSSLFLTYLQHEKHNNYSMHKKLTNYFKSKFPKFDINFEYMWPGLIGITKDLVPLAGSDKNNKNIYYISGVAGLPWAAALGHYSAEKLIEGRGYFDDYFSPYRDFPLGNGIQNVIGKKLTFAISNFMSLKSI